MLIGARTAAWGGKSWVNPYITDGLVAMWDGEWNAGGGIHDSSANTWVDLVGGDEIILSRASWDYNVFFGICSYTKDLGIDSKCTFEICFSGAGGDGWLPTFTLNRCGAAGTGSTETVAYLDKYHNYKHFVPLLTTKTFLISENNTIERFFENGTVSNIGNITWNGTRSESTEIVIKTCSTLLKNKIAFIRVYSRQLSEQEIFNNYRIDSERFPLES